MACRAFEKQVPVKDVAEAWAMAAIFLPRRAFKRVMGLAPSYYAEGLDNK